MTTPDRTERRLLTAVALLMVLGAAMRLYQLDTGLWFDEIVTLLVSVRPPLSTIVSQFPGNNDHPLYSVLAHGVVSVLGESPWTVRLPSAIIGVATIPALYWLGRSVTTAFEAFLAASILTVSYHHVWFSQNARGYTLLLLCVVVSTHLLIRWLDDGRPTHAVWYAIVAALGTYTHLTMVFVCVSHAIVCGVVLLQRSSSREAWKQLLWAFGGAGLLTILLYAPKLADVRVFFTEREVTGTEVATPLWALWEAVQGLQLGFGTAWGIAAGAAIFGAGAWSYARQSVSTLFLFVLPVPVTLGIAIVMGRPIFPRFVFFALGFALLITIRGASTLGEWAGRRIRLGVTAPRAGTMAAALVTAGAVAFSIRSLPYGYRYPKQDFGQAAVFVEQSKRQGDLVAVVGVTAAVPMRDYHGKAWPRIDRESELQELRVKGHEVWVVFTFPAYIAANAPTLWAILQDECQQVARFEGTVAGGAINVARCAPSGI